MIPGYTATQLANIVQGSPEWIEARKGCVGASGVADAVAMLKRGTGETQARYKYKTQIVAERLGCWLTEHYVSDAMRWGIENEPLARTAYELRYEAEVDTVGIIAHPTIDMTLCSPDGLVGVDGLIEIKCPMTSTHFAYMDEGILPPEYEPQVHWQLACTGRKWCDFISFDPRLPERFQFFRFHAERDEAKIAALEESVRVFLSEVEEMISRFENLNPPLKEQLQASVQDTPLTGDFDADMGIVADDLFGDERLLTT